MSEPWTTKQRAWLKTCYLEGRKVSEFESEFEAVFGLKRTRASFYQCLQKIKQEENLPVVKIRKEWVLPEITKVVELYGVMSVPGIARVLGRTPSSVASQVAKMKREGLLSRKKRVRVCWLSEREQAMEREWGL